MGDTKEQELEKALNITLTDGSLPTNEQLENAADKWKKALDSPYRLQADKDFLAGAIWGIQLMTGAVNKFRDYPTEDNLKEVRTVQPNNQMTVEDSYRYHTMCARATLYPNKTIEEVESIIEDTISKWKLGC